MKKTMLFLLAVLTSGAFFGCGWDDGQSRKGGGLEIPNGVEAAVTIRLTDSMGVALPSAKVYLVAGETWADRVLASSTVVVDSALTDSQGVVELELTETRMFLLARYQDQGVHLALQPRDSTGTSHDNPLPVAMRRLAQLRFKAEKDRHLLLYGTPWKVAAASIDGQYRLDSVPAGDYMPVGYESYKLSMGQTTGTMEFDTTTDVQSVTFSDPNNLMLTNFENRRLLGIWDPMHVGGFWWATALVDGVASWDHFGMRVLDDLLDSSDGNVFAGVDVNFASAGETMANFGLDFSTEPVNTNLSKATYIRFKARGSGTWNVYVQTQDSLGGNKLRWMHPLTVSSQWAEYRLPLQAFICQTDNAVQWNEEVRLGTNLFWQTESNGSLRIDDVVIEGLQFRDWVDP